MRFENIEILNWLWIIAVIIILIVIFQYRKKRFLDAFAPRALMAHLLSSFDEKRQNWKNILFVLIFFFSIIALARPQWGFQLREITQQGIDILIAIDTSKSMLTRDVKPNRLERAKLAVKDLLHKLNGDRVGLIAFAGEAFLVSPLTSDYNGLLLSLQDMDIDTIPRGGTNIASAVELAIKEYKEEDSQHRAIIIISDGENLQDNPIPMAKEAKDKGIKIYTVGIGTQEGELIQIENSLGKLEFLKNQEGNAVKSRLDEKTLQEIALATGGVYIRASGAQLGLDIIYQKELSKLEKREFDRKKEKQYYERFQIPLGIALMLLILETCLVPRKK